MPDAPAFDPLAVVEASPTLVLRKDLEGWLAIYADDALIEDPVGADRYRGKARIEAFWRVFIAPQERIVFHPRRNFVTPRVVMRQVRIESITPVSPEPVNVEAIIEYRLRPPERGEGTLITSMRAFWQVRDPVTWHFGQGLAGLHGLLVGIGLGRGNDLGAFFLGTLLGLFNDGLGALVGVGDALSGLGAGLRQLGFNALVGGRQLGLGLVGGSKTVRDLAGTLVERGRDRGPDEFHREPDQDQEHDHLGDEGTVDVHFDASITVTDNAALHKLRCRPATAGRGGGAAAPGSSLVLTWAGWRSGR